MNDDIFNDKALERLFSDIQHDDNYNGRDREDLWEEFFWVSFVGKPAKKAWDESKQMLRRFERTITSQAKCPCGRNCSRMRPCWE